MSSADSVTLWLAALHDDPTDAARRLWERYVEKLVRLASRKLGALPRRAADEDDVVAEVFADFLQGVREGRFTRLQNRHDLWQILAMLTERNAIGLIRRETAAKRGRGRVRGESAFAPGSSADSAAPGIGRVVDREPSPEFAVQLSELLSQRLRQLDNDLLRGLARDSLAGYSQREMAARHGISLPTVERKLKLIRQQWQSELEP